MGAMGDFARMPTRQKVMVFIVIGGLLGALYWQFIFKGLKDAVASAEGENKAKAGQNVQLAKDIDDFKKLKDRMANLKRIIDENQKALPTETELPAFFDMLNRKVLESGVEVVRSKQGKEQPVESFVKVPIEYEIQGTFVQIKRFFASLVPKKKKPGQQTEPKPEGEQEVEEKERIVSIENLSLTNATVRNREIRLTAKFIASTYRQEEKKAPEPAKDPKAKPGAPAPAPLPPASTPAGAKARTEGAIDKADQRAKDGSNDAKPASAERMKGGL